MAATNTDGSMVVDSDLGGLLAQVLGTEVDKDTASNQTTTGSGTQTGTSSGTSTGSNVNVGTTSNTGTTSGQTAQVGQSTGSSNSATANTNHAVNDSTTNSVNNSVQNVSGVTNTSGVSKTTGGTNTTTDTTKDFNSTETTSADIVALQEIVARQLAGITPEHLASIFSEGSKAAPQLISSQANALGSRASGSSPLAMALNLLNGQLTGKAADLNYNMLRDAMTSASKIGDLTKSVNTAGSEHTVQNTATTTDMTTETSQQQVMNQLINTMTTGTAQTKGTTDSTGTSLTASTNVNNNSTFGTNSGTNTNTGTTSNIGTTSGTTNNTSVGTNNQTQNTTGTESVNTQQTINTNIASGLASMYAAGVGINELFKIATGKGFVGTAQDLLKWLQGNSGGGTIVGSESGEVMDGGVTGDPYNPGDGDLGGGTGDGLITDIGDTGGDLGDIDIGDIGDIDLGGGFADGGRVTRRYADGGMATPAAPIPQAIINIPSLFKKSAQETGAQRQDNGVIAKVIMQLLGGITGTKKMADGGTLRAIDQVDISKATPEFSTVSANFSDANDTGTERVRTTGQMGELVAGGTVQRGGNTEGAGDIVGDPTNYYRQVSSDGADGLTDVYDATGKFQMRDTDTGSGAYDFAQALVPILASIFMPGVGAVMAAGQVDQASDSGDVGGMLAGLAAMYGASGGEYANYAQLASKAYNTSQAVENKNYTGAITGAIGLGKGIIGATGGTAGSTPTTDGMADGGPVTSSGTNNDDLLKAVGIKRDGKGSYTVGRDTLKLIHTALTKSSVKDAPGYSDGGTVQGPGTGISDSVPAIGPGGQQIALSNGELVIPADVVEKFGEDFFQRIIDEHHVPADMQRAMGVR